VADEKVQAEQSSPSTSEAELREILALHEAGVADVLAAYELVEKHYVAAATATPRQNIVTYTTGTSGS